MNTVTIPWQRVPNVLPATPEITRAVEMRPFVLNSQMLNLRGVGPKRIRKLVEEGSLQRIQRGAYIYTRDAQALTPRRAAHGTVHRCSDDGSSRDLLPRISRGAMGT